MIEITDKSKCSGCTACYSVCPKGAIEMTLDNEGFRYPKVNIERCVNCGLCDKTCPEAEPYFRVGSSYSEKYAAQNISEGERNQSTAGGFFSIIADYVISDCSGSVFAVGFDGVTVIHKEATELCNLTEMRGSKYVQSNVGDTFNAVKKRLHEGKTCLFVGTPCQVNAIEKFLAKDKARKNLISIDLLCLGVSSPMLYEKWVAYLQNKYKDKVKRVYFRDKSYGYATANVRVTFEKRRYIEQCYDAKSLLKTFFTGYNMRPSCYDCSFRCVERASDFTIGDFHQIGRSVPSMDDDKGTTCVWAHSENARKLMREFKTRMRAECIDEKCSRQIADKSKLVKMPERRDEFFADFNKMSYEEFVGKWAKNDLKGQIVNVVRVVVNRLPFKSSIFKLMKRMKSKSFKKA